MIEEWRDINEIYEVSSLGQIRNKRSARILKLSKQCGYLTVKTPKKREYVHILVARAFLGTTKGLVVNHKDGNKVNNRLDNLEVVTHAENSKHALDTGLTRVHKKRVNQYTKEGVLIATYNSIIEASITTGVSDKLISSVCRERRKTAGGYVWKHADVSPQTARIEEPPGIEVESYPNYVVTRNGQVYSRKMKKMVIPRNIDGYEVVRLSKDRVITSYRVHRLVAHAYLPSIEGKLVVNHKNFVRHDNRVENLEWVTSRENALHAIQRRDYGRVVRRYRITVVRDYSRANLKPASQRNSRSKAVVQLDGEEVIRIFPNMTIAAEVSGAARERITKVCKGERDLAGGFSWRYATSDETSDSQ